MAMAVEVAPVVMATVAYLAPVAMVAMAAAEVRAERVVVVERVAVAHPTVLRSGQTPPRQSAITRLPVQMQVGAAMAAMAAMVVMGEVVMPYMTTIPMTAW